MNTYLSELLSHLDLSQRGLVIPLLFLATGSTNGKNKTCLLPTKNTVKLKIYRWTAKTPNCRVFFLNPNLCQIGLLVTSSGNDMNLIKYANSTSFTKLTEFSIHRVSK